MLVALDTATELAGIACYDAHGIRGECCWYTERRHGAQVLPQLDMLLRHIGSTPSEIQAVAVGLGPGSWSGLRVGVSIAKGLALAGNLTLLGIGTLDAIAYQYEDVEMPIHPVIRVGRGRIATATWLWDRTLQRMSPYQNIAVAELGTIIRGNAWFCGDVDAAMQQDIRAIVGAYAHFPSDPARIRRPGVLASLAWHRFCAGEHDEMARIEPLYLGEPLKGREDHVGTQSL